jgi:hypothetical protein
VNDDGSVLAVHDTDLEKVARSVAADELVNPSSRSSTRIGLLNA